MALPLLIGGAIIAGTGLKVYKDTKEIEELNRRAEEEKEKGDRYRRKAEEVAEKLKWLGERGKRELEEGFEKGARHLARELEQLNRYGDLSLILGRGDLREKYLRFLMEEAHKLHLEDLSWGDLELIFEAVRELESRHHHGAVDSISIEKGDVEEADVEAVATMFAHGFLSAGVGGAATLVGFEFLAATGVGALVLAPFILIGSGEKVEEARRNLRKARDYREEAEMNYRELEGKVTYLRGLVELGEMFNSTIDRIIQVDIAVKKRIPENPDLFDQNLGKHIITLAYLGKILKFNPMEGVGELGDLTQSTLNRWKAEQRRLRQLRRELEELKEAPVEDVRKNRMIATAKQLFFETLQERGVQIQQQVLPVLQKEGEKLKELPLGTVAEKLRDRNYLSQLGEKVSIAVKEGAKKGRQTPSIPKVEEVLPVPTQPCQWTKEEIVQELLQILASQLKELFSENDKRSFTEKLGVLIGNLFQFLAEVLKAKALGAASKLLYNFIRKKILRAMEGFKSFLRLIGRALGEIKELAKKWWRGELSSGEFFKLALRAVVFALIFEVGVVIEEFIADRVGIPGVGEGVGIVVAAGISAAIAAFYLEVIEKYLFFIGKMSPETLELLQRLEREDEVIKKAIGEVHSHRREWEREFQQRRWEIEAQLTDNFKALLDPKLTLQEFEARFQEIGKIFGVQFREEPRPELAHTLREPEVTGVQLLKEKEFALRRAQLELEELEWRGGDPREIERRRREVEELRHQLEQLRRW